MVLIRLIRGFLRYHLTRRRSLVCIWSIEGTNGQVLADGLANNQQIAWIPSPLPPDRSVARGSKIGRFLFYRYLVYDQLIQQTSKLIVLWRIQSRPDEQIEDFFAWGSLLPIRYILLFQDVDTIGRLRKNQNMVGVSRELLMEHLQDAAYRMIQVTHLCVAVSVDELNTHRQRTLRHLRCFLDFSLQDRRYKNLIPRPLPKASYSRLRYDLDKSGNNYVRELTGCSPDGSLPESASTDSAGSGVAAIQTLKGLGFLIGQAKQSLHSGFRSTKGAAFGFYIQVYEDFQETKACLRDLRQVYPEAAVLLMSDGDPDPRFRVLANQYDAEFQLGERLFPLAHGGGMIQRMLRCFEAMKVDYCFKIDPDTVIRRRFRSLPTDPCLFGSLQTNRVEWSIQGGCVGFGLGTVKKLLNSGVFTSPELKDPRTWTLALSVDGYARSSGLIRFEWLLCYGAYLIGLPMVELQECRSQWLRAPTPSWCFSVTHPRIDKENRYLPS